ncbi:MAG: sigma-70 family RNA polymerase sigma factor [Armatimonadota bacterium]|nr:sigma-70 family RNA polymerase sigma factor [Armatimonadota bacterium]MDR7532560.1 sigma-70 family RNA polymerase sigma factor [Armatimonadota bacterium]MDR7536231.1 sigma-70 family RNA polymerase sigma factor [Armatimonadota bacterium]
MRDRAATFSSGPAAPGSGPDGLAAAYVQTRDPAARDALVRMCEPLVRGVAAEYANPGQSDDLVQVGYVGLLHAIEHFDPTRGTPFLIFARHFIRGEIRHYLRDHHTTMRRPRWLERVNDQIDQATYRHLGTEGRYPGFADLAAALGVDEETLAHLLRTRQAVRTLSLDVETDEGEPGIDLGQVAGLRAQWDAAMEDRLVVLDALGRLNPLQRAVIFYIFFTDLTQVQTARRLGVSQKHVSRVLAAALARLRALLRADAGVEDPAVPHPDHPSAPAAEAAATATSSRLARA